jgi:hypothetical protein
VTGYDKPQPKRVADPCGSIVRTRWGHAICQLTKYIDVDSCETSGENTVISRPVNGIDKRRAKFVVHPLEFGSVGVEIKWECQELQRRIQANVSKTSGYPSCRRGGHALFRNFGGEQHPFVFEKHARNRIWKPSLREADEFGRNVHELRMRSAEISDEIIDILGKISLASPRREPRKHRTDNVQHVRPEHIAIWLESPCAGGRTTSLDRGMDF